MNRQSREGVWDNYFGYCFCNITGSDLLHISYNVYGSSFTVYIDDKYRGVCDSYFSMCACGMAFEASG